MVELDYKQRKVIGAAFVFELLAPVTPYGTDAARNIKPFARGDELLLAAELENVYNIMVNDGGLSDRASLCNILCNILSRFKDVRGSVRKLASGSGASLSEVELFEIKGFLLTLDELSDIYNRVNKRLNLSGIEITAMDDALQILDPDGTRLRSLYVSEVYSDKLRRIRLEKRDIDAKMNICRDKETYNMLERERLIIAAREEDEELVVRRCLSEQLTAYKRMFEINIESILRLDMMLAKAALALKYSCVKPVITENTITLTDMYSPEVDAVLRKRGGNVTPVSLELSPGCAVLTGANMGGKSVSLKTLALNVYLFQCGFMVFAKSAALPMVDNLDFIFWDEQSVYTGLSSFGAEMVSVNAILNRAERQFSLIILDEPAKGTNPREGRAIAAGLAALLNTLPSVSILATHYDNVAKDDYNCYITAGLRKDLPARGTEAVSPETIARYMDYRLVKASPGLDVPNDALSICELLNVSDALLKTIKSEL